jgi:hypothetical protein
VAALNKGVAKAEDVPDFPLLFAKRHQDFVGQRRALQLIRRQD